MIISYFIDYQFPYWSWVISHFQLNKSWSQIRVRVRDDWRSESSWSFTETNSWSDFTQVSTGESVIWCSRMYRFIWGSAVVDSVSIRNHIKDQSGLYCDLQNRSTQTQTLTLYVLLIDVLIIDCFLSGWSVCRLWSFSSVSSPLFFWSAVADSSWFPGSAWGLKVTTSLVLITQSDLRGCYWSAVTLLCVCRGVVEPEALSGRMVIAEGAMFSEDLRNSSSLSFKSLAFDVQQLVRSGFYFERKQTDLTAGQIRLFWKTAGKVGQYWSVPISIDRYWSILIATSQRTHYVWSKTSYFLRTCHFLKTELHQLWWSILIWSLSSGSITLETVCLQVSSFTVNSPDQCLNSDWSTGVWGVRSHWAQTTLQVVSGVNLQVSYLINTDQSHWNWSIISILIKHTETDQL